MSVEENYLKINDNETIKVALFKPDSKPKKQAVLFLHGWTGKPNNRAAEFLSNHGYTCLTLIFRGHPGSSKKLNEISRSDSLKDALVAYDYLKSNITEDTKICVAGSSYGGYMAAVLSSERSFNGMSLRVPANYTDEGFELPQINQGHENPGVTEWRNMVAGYTETRSLNAVHEFKGLIQIIEAEFDDFVPKQTLHNYRDAVNAKKMLEYHLMKGWSHSLGNHPERNMQYQKMLLSWVENLS